MRISIGIILSLLFLTGCPTPPEDVQGAAGNSNMQGGGKNGPPGQPGNGQGGNGQGGNGPEGNGPPGQPGNGPEGNGQGGQGPGDGQAGGPPPGQGGNGQGGNGPEGNGPEGNMQDGSGSLGDGQNIDGVPGQVAQYPNADGKDADPESMNSMEQGGTGGDGNMGGPGGDGNAQMGGDQNGQQGGPPPGQGGPDGAGGQAQGPIEGQLLLPVDKENNAQPQFTQEALSSKSNVTFSGVAKCDGCKGDLVLRATKFISQDEQPTEDLVTTKKLDGPGKFTILLPEGEDPVNLELLVDENQDGKPSKGERFANLEIKDQLPTKDQSGFELDASDGELDNIPEDNATEGAAGQENTNQE